MLYILLDIYVSVCDCDLVPVQWFLKQKQNQTKWLLLFHNHFTCDCGLRRIVLACTCSIFSNSCIVFQVDPAHQRLFVLWVFGTAVSSTPEVEQAWVGVHAVSLNFSGRSFWYDWINSASQISFQKSVVSATTYEQHARRLFAICQKVLGVKGFSHYLTAFFLANELTSSSLICWFSTWISLLAPSMRSSCLFVITLY